MLSKRGSKHPSKQPETSDVRSQTSESQDQVAEEVLNGLPPETAAAVTKVFALLECEPFGSFEFQIIFEEAATNGASSWVDAMEDTIKFCKKKGVQVPGRFYQLKHAIEKLDAEQKFKRTPL